MKVASRKDATSRSLAQRRADFQAQAERYLAAQEAMAVADLTQVRKRLKGLRRELQQKDGKKVQQYAVANLLDVAPRTFQSWENGEVETEGRNYDLVAGFYSEKLGRKISRNWILFGQEEPPQEANPPAALSAVEDGDQLNRIERKLDRVLKRIEELEAEESGAEVDTVLAEGQRPRRDEKQDG